MTYTVPTAVEARDLCAVTTVYRLNLQVRALRRNRVDEMSEMLTAAADEARDLAAWYGWMADYEVRT